MPRTSAQRAMAWRLASIQARSGAAAQRIESADQAARPPIAARARRPAPRAGAARSQARTTAATARGAPRARRQEGRRWARAAEAVARVDAAAADASEAQPGEPRSAPIATGAAMPARRARRRACPPSGAAATIRDALGATPPVSLTGWLPCSDAPPGCSSSSRWRSSALTASALADGRDVLADAKDNQRVDGCYTRAEFRDALAPGCATISDSTRVLRGSSSRTRRSPT